MSQPSDSPQPPAPDPSADAPTATVSPAVGPAVGSPDTAAPIATEFPADLKLTELLQIMSVATELRQQADSVEQQVRVDETRAHIKQRLMNAARESGEVLTDEQAELAITWYYDHLHTFRPPPATWEVWFARVYIRRGLIGGLIAGTCAAVLLWWFLFQSAWGPFSPAGQQQRELALVLQHMWELKQRGEHVVQSDSDKSELKSLVTEIRALIRDRQGPQAAAGVERLRQLVDELDGEYTVEIVAEPGEKTGVDSYYTDESGTRISGYYLIVEALGPQRQKISRVIDNAETQTRETVSRWGERVPKEVYDRIAADKRDDGILEEKLFARKQRGQRQEEMLLRDANGQPLTRSTQITRW